MKKRYKALMLDLDGTTMPSKIDGMPSQRVKNAIAVAKDKIHICIATGRPLHLALPVIQHLELTDPSIILDGTVILNPVSQKIIYEQPISQDDLRKIIPICKTKNLEIIVDTRETSFKYQENTDLKDIICLVVVNMTIEQTEELQESLSHIPTIVTHKIKAWEEGKTSLSITHVSATKQHAILEVAKILRIDTHEIIGVGDGYNDFPLLMACGLKIAMGNAVPELKAIADYIAPTVEEDGVAEVIEKFILNK